MNIPLTRKAELQAAKRRYAAGKITESELYTYADAYIQAVRDHCKARNLKPPRMTRTGVIRTV